LRWIISISVVLVLGALAILPAAFADDGLTLDGAIEIRGTMTGTLPPTGQVWYKFHNGGDRKPLGIVLKFEPYPGSPDNDVSFNVWTKQRQGSSQIMENVMLGTATESGLSAMLPGGYKYWQGSTDVPRTYYLQVFNNHPSQAISFALAGTGAVFPPPTPELAAPRMGIMNAPPPGTPPVSSMIYNSTYIISETRQIGPYIIRVWFNRGPIKMVADTIVSIGASGVTPVQIEQVAGINPLTGRDITGSGAPSLVIDTYTGGAHCCFNTQVYELGQVFNKVLDTRPSACSVKLEDMEGGGVYAATTCDDTFTYKYCSFADSPLVRVILKYTPGQGYLPASPAFAHLYQPDIEAHSALLSGQPGARSEPDGTNKCSVLPLVLDYLYSGAPDQAWAVIEQWYPFPDRDEWWLDIRRSATASELFTP
jgi:hypothetical protein